MTEKKRGKRFGILVTFVAMFVFWLLLSGIFDLFHIIGGVVSSVIVALISYDLFVREGGLARDKLFRLLLYIPWELWQITMANLDVAYRVLHPKMPIDPRIIEFETSLRSDFALVTMGNSITLTPGTITIWIDPERGKFWVHAIAKSPADGLLVDKAMQTKVAEVYGEK